jgi:hypothetical protein
LPIFTRPAQRDAFHDDLIVSDPCVLAHMGDRMMPKAVDRAAQHTMWLPTPRPWRGTRV